MRSLDDLNRRMPQMRRFAIGAVIGLSLGMLATAGCSSTATEAAPNAAGTELTFDLSKCQPIDAHIFKCPAVDKPICDPDYTGSQVTQCLRIGRKGSVFVAGPGGE